MPRRTSPASKTKPKPDARHNAPTYRQLEAAAGDDHPVDVAVRRRVGRKDLLRRAAAASDAIVAALGKQRRLWFAYEQAAEDLRARREAAYFDVGVECGITAARANQLAGGQPVVQALAERLVRELQRAGVRREDRVAAAIAAAWAVVADRAGRDQR